MKPLDAFLCVHVRELLKEKGFSRKGRDFRLTAPSGDVALISFFSWRLDDCEVEFYLDAGILPLAKVEWERDVLGATSGSVASALWWTRLGSPFKASGLWQFDLDDNERISLFLEKLASLADCLRSLTDRQNLISVVRETEIQQLRASREHALAFLLVEEGASPELESILRRLESHNPDDGLAAWVRARLSSNRSGKPAP